MEGVNEHGIHAGTFIGPPVATLPAMPVPHSLSYLLGALRHFESDLRERARRLKRGGGVQEELRYLIEVLASPGG